ncbi:MAG TPA: phosphotransferase enzyme family protein, partial [Spirochaetes bacterium]|nr:phosphotransferase enzyme family protein [Spirochaetota bacterium]
REYYRITGSNITAIGVYNADHKENIAFLSFTKHFYKKKLPVPEVYAEDLNKNIYLIQDLGDITLFSYLMDIQQDGAYPNDLLSLYKKVIDQIPKFQVPGSEGLDYSVCYPRAAFDKQSMMWDLSYFKYYFLKLAKIPFDEQLLEDDFHKFTDYLLQADSHYFLYRDLQSRNIMIHDDRPYFIDYQGGRKGALQYDPASLLFDSKANIPQGIRGQLLEYYMDTLQQFTPVDRDQFIQYFYGYALIRIMQAMGAYGFRGFYEKKEHFLDSIPFALKDLQTILKIIDYPIDTPILFETFQRLLESEELKAIHKKKKAFTVWINSFSYRKGIPMDQSGEGGGYVFDCRSLSPVKPEYLTDSDSIDEKNETASFLNHVYGIIDLSIKGHLEQKKNSLTVSFGCTQGQRRAVYCADRLAAYLNGKDDIDISLSHKEMDNK